jgi:ubiquitin-protein ligase
MSNKRLKRIMNEFKELENSKKILEESGIYFYFNEDNINYLYALLIGPEGTPYEKGFYFFSFEYPLSYPMQPPIAKYYTQGSLINPISSNKFYIRFNPNLYVCGKVCLSMLNTWSGPGWVPTNTMSNVLVAIQALVLNDFPLMNEPGFETASVKELIKYNEIISYANIKISVLDMLENIPKDFTYFTEIIHDYFLKNIDYYRKYVITKSINLNKTLIESPAYGMKILADYNILLEEIDLKSNQKKN